MQAGQAGVIVLILAIITSTAGGFIANTTQSTACATDFTYITDVAGAFTGQNGNIEIEHDPVQNITGYSVYSPDSEDYKNSTASGITYSVSTTPNGYWIQERTGDPDTQTLTISHNRSQNNSNPGTVTYNFGSGTNPTSSISGQWGLDNAEIRTVLFVEGTTHTRVAGVTVYDLVKAYMTWAGLSSIDTNAIRIYFNTDVDEYPGFVTDQSFNLWDAAGAGSYYGLNNEVRYSNIINDIVVNPSNGSVRINNVSYAWNKVYAVWGTSGSTSAAMTMILGGTVVTEYINPLNGVKPISVSVDDPTQAGDTANAVHVEGSLYVPADGQTYIFDWMIEYKESTSGTYKTLTRVTIIFNSGNGEYDVMDMGGHTILSGNTQHGFYVDPITINWDWNENDLANISFWAGTGSMPVSPATRVVTNIPDNGIYELKSTYPNNYSNLNNIVVTLTNNSTVPIDSDNNTGGSAFEYITTYNLPAEVTYTTTYWSNGVENTKLSMLIQRPSADTDNIMFAQYRLTDDTYLTEPFRIAYKNNQWQFYDESNNPVELGNWPAMMLTISISSGQHYYILTPVSSFTDFQTYTLVNREYTYTSSTVGPILNPSYEALIYIQFTNTDQLYPYHEIMNTTVLLDDGGLYLNNAWFSPGLSFPTDQIVQFRIMGSPHAGQSVTITTSTAQPYDESFDLDGSYEYETQNLILGYLPGGEFATDTSIPGITIQTAVFGGTPHLYLSGQATVDGTYYVQAMKYNGSDDPATPYTLQFIVRGAENPALDSSITYDVNGLGNGLIINGKSYLFNEIGLYYVDASTPTVVIAGESYEGGLYINGQFLEKGHLYLQAGRNGVFTDLGESNNQWTIQLNGIWAVSTAYYTGENQATSVIVWDEPGKWHWDANLTIICFLAVTIIGLVVMARLYELSIWDWIIPIAACIISFMLLGW